ncbi:VOC family protein [Echinicola jeungdonensis]|uniref:VOC family protein n=1 Tax=Echinicola jeungdonensis TaxID=709343 RepID=A0ABV5J2L2_9BACT|nr:VOC family protein [Echinicola jeungdonensis]MDN3670133.1 VOC family protein [Echinicola jeungdonensis]
MTSINPYLTFDGNCEDAFNFYQSVFGGEFTYVGRFSEMPSEFTVSDKDKNKIMHISLPISKETTLMGSDSVSSFGPSPIFGNNFSISVNTDSKEEADRVFKELSAGGKVTMPMEKAFWGDYFGMFTDKFGINWMVSQRDDF